MIWCHKIHILVFSDRSLKGWAQPLISSQLGAEKDPNGHSMLPTLRNSNLFLQHFLPLPGSLWYLRVSQPPSLPLWFLTPPHLLFCAFTEPAATSPSLLAGGPIWGSLPSIGEASDCGIWVLSVESTGSIPPIPPFGSHCAWWQCWHSTCSPTGLIKSAASIWMQGQRGHRQHGHICATVQ